MDLVRVVKENYEIIIPQGEPKQESLEEAMRQNGYYDKPSDDLINLAIELYKINVWNYWLYYK